MLTFEPNKTLLNPRFEGYKLDAIDQDRVLTRFKLEHSVRQSSAAGKSPLSFQEVQSRIRHNHLVLGPNGQVVYIDAETRVMMVTWDETASHLRFDALYEIPRVVQSGASDVDGPHSEYPSAAFVDDATLLVSDGNGVLYVLKLGQTGSTTLYNSYELRIPEVHHSAYPAVPFRIHFAKRDEGANTCLALLSSKHYRARSEESEASASVGASTNRKGMKKSRFDVWAVTINFDQVQQDQLLTLDIKWHRRGEDVPSYVAFVESKDAFMLLGSSPYRPLTMPALQTYEPSADEMAPIPRAGEILDNAPSGNSSTVPPKPPPYSWTQTTDSVTIAFALPSDTPKNAIKVTFSATTLSLFVQEPGTDTLRAAAAPPLPRYALKKFWDGIHTATSFWTFDREAEHAYGLLTLHLDKQHEGTRWSHVFAEQANNGEPDVPETLDPSELLQIRDALEKYTAALQTGEEDASGLGLGRGVPSLAEGEMDDEVDLDMGDSLFVTWVGAAEGDAPPWSVIPGGGAPVSVLATPLPATGARRNPSVVVKHGLDGLLYEFDTERDAEWRHTTTFHALSFVLASKRDTRFVHHMSSKAVLAFESGARDLGSNVYVYRGSVRTVDKTAKQAVLKIGDTSSGPLLGVGMLHVRDGSGKDVPVILCLCEREMVVIQDAL